MRYLGYLVGTRQPCSWESLLFFLLQVGWSNPVGVVEESFALRGSVETSAPRKKKPRLFVECEHANILMVEVEGVTES